MHLQIDVLYLFNEIFNISEYKAMLIKLLIYHRNIYFIHVYVGMGIVKVLMVLLLLPIRYFNSILIGTFCFMYIYIYLYISIYIYIYIYMTN